MCRLARESQTDPKSAVTSDVVADAQDVLFEIAANFEPSFPRMDVRAVGQVGKARYFEAHRLACLFLSQESARRSTT